MSATVSEPCPVRVVPESDESKSVAKWSLDKLDRYAADFKGRVDRQADSSPDWTWEGWMYNHPALPDAEHMVVYASKWDCLCALLVALTKDLSSEGFGPDSEVMPLPRPGYPNGPPPVGKSKHGGGLGL